MAVDDAALIRCAMFEGAWLRRAWNRRAASLSIEKDDRIGTPSGDDSARVAPEDVADTCPSGGALTRPTCGRYGGASQAGAARTQTSRHVDIPAARASHSESHDFTSAASDTATGRTREAAS